MVFFILRDVLGVFLDVVFKVILKLRGCFFILEEAYGGCFMMFSRASSTLVDDF